MLYNYIFHVKLQLKKTANAYKQFSSSIIKVWSEFPWFDENLSKQLKISATQFIQTNKTTLAIILTVYKIYSQCIGKKKRNYNKNYG